MLGKDFNEFLCGAQKIFQRHQKRNFKNVSWGEVVSVA